MVLEEKLVQELNGTFTKKDSSRIISLMDLVERLDTSRMVSERSMWVGGKMESITATDNS